MANFIKEYIKHPRSVGAIKPSGAELASKMIEPIDFDKAEVIVEYGPGTGAFSYDIIKNKRKETKFIMIEINKDFYEGMKSVIKEKDNVFIVNDGAQNIKEVMKKYKIDKVDYIISGLPFASLPAKLSNEILKNTIDALGDGLFITFQYTKLKEKLFKKFFNIKKILKAQKNVPPAYVYILNNDK